MKTSSYQCAVATTLAVALVIVGCGKPQADTRADAANPDTPPAADAQPAAAAAEPASDTTTNAALSPGAEFATKSQASPFATSDMGLKETYDRALIAFQIGDYARAADELRDLAANPDLNPAQKKAVAELLAQTLKLAPALAATNAGPSSGTPPSTFPLAGAQTEQPPANLPQNPFSTADPAVKDTFARAKAAFDIGNYAVALSELQGLVTNTQLNFQQKYAVQSLLDKVPRSAAPR
jgi:hypothetical protein